MNKPTEPSEIAMEIARSLLVDFAVEYYDRPIDDYVPASQTMIAVAIDAVLTDILFPITSVADHERERMS